MNVLATHRWHLTALGGALVLLGVALDAEAATTLNPADPPDGYIVGTVVRACSTTGMEEAPAPRITAPSGAFTDLVPDSDECVGFRFTAEAGTWTLTYTDEATPVAVQQTVRIEVGPNADDQFNYMLGSLAILLVWLVLVFVSQRPKTRGMKSTVAALGLVLLVFPMPGAMTAVVLFGTIGVLFHHTLRGGK